MYVSKLDSLIGKHKLESGFLVFFAFLLSRVDLSGTDVMRSSWEKEISNETAQRL